MTAGCVRSGLSADLRMWRAERDRATELLHRLAEIHLLDGTDMPVGAALIFGDMARFRRRRRDRNSHLARLKTGLFIPLELGLSLHVAALLCSGHSLVSIIDAQSCAQTKPPVNLTP